MPNRVDTRDIHLDPIHCQAVRQGIGEKLRDALNRETPDMSQRLRSLIARLPELDGEKAPSLVPEMETH
jgi:hypothetical protein